MNICLASLLFLHQSQDISWDFPSFETWGPTSSNITGTNNGIGACFWNITWKKSNWTHLSNIFEVIVSFLQGSGSVKWLPNTRVFAKESLAVVFYPVHHLEEREHAEIIFSLPPTSTSAPETHVPSLFLTENMQIDDAGMKNNPDEASMIWCVRNCCEVVMKLLCSHSTCEGLQLLNCHNFLSASSDPS